MPRVKCPRCGTIVEHAIGFQPICPACGYGSDAAATAPATAPAAMPQPMFPPLSTPPAPAGKAQPSQGLAIVGLILNIVVWPGLGSLIAGRQEGWAQGFLTLLGVILTVTLIFIFVGVPLMIGMWIWGIVSGVKAIQDAAPPRPAPAMA